MSMVERSDDPPETREVSMQIRLLGPIEACLGERPVDLRGPRQRRLLARLALSPGSLVDGAELIDAVWADGELPSDPRETLRTYASRLRSALGDPHSVNGRAGGYLLEVPRLASTDTSSSRS